MGGAGWEMPQSGHAILRIMRTIGFRVLQIALLP